MYFYLYIITFTKDYLKHNGGVHLIIIHPLCDKYTNI